jgi:predicted nucleic acid-binding Zn finger protein
VEQPAGELYIGKVIETKPMNKAVFYEIPSTTIKGKKYIVRKMPDGFWKCSCPRFVFNGKKCRHIKKLQHLKI